MSLTFTERLKRYCDDVLSGRVLACEYVKQAVKRHRNDLRRFRAKKSPFYFSDAHVEHVCQFAELMPHIEGTWPGDGLIDLEDWQVFQVGMIFGWRKTHDHSRRFSKVYLEVARKNAKSTLIAVLGLYCFSCEGEPAPYIFVGATTGAQAQKVFHPMRMMVSKNHAFREQASLKVWARSITEPGGGYVQTINSRAQSQDGHNPHAVLLDEIHSHPTRQLYDVMDSAMGARRNPIMFLITTAGFNTEGIAFEQRKFLVGILSGVVEADHFYGCIYTLDEADEAAAREGTLDSRFWIKSNPNLGVSVMVDNMEKAALEAKEQPGKAGEFMTKRLNIWTTARAGYVNIPKWKLCDGTIDLDKLASDGVPCWGGLDLGSVSDLTSWRLVWLHEGKLITWGRRYLPEAAVTPRSEKNAVPYARWANMRFMNDPYLCVTPGDTMDYSAPERDIRAAMQRFRVQAIGFDPWNAQDLCNRLMADNVPMVEVRQGFGSLSAPMKEISRRYLNRQLVHGGDEILQWCASNVVAATDENDNVRPSKKQSMEKIDDFSALLNATAVMLATAKTTDIDEFLNNPVGWKRKDAA